MLAVTYTSSEIKAQPGRNNTDAGPLNVAVQAGPFSRRGAQLSALHKHVISKGTHPSRVECGAALLADATPRLSL